jgi:hypothetical protein
LLFLLFLVPHLPKPLAEGQDGWARSRTNEHGVPVQSGHVQVEQQHVRAGGGDDVNRLPAVSGFAGDLNVWFLAEQVAQPVPWRPAQSVPHRVVLRSAPTGQETESPAGWLLLLGSRPAITQADLVSISFLFYRAC